MHKVTCLYAKNETHHWTKKRNGIFFSFYLQFAEGKNGLAHLCQHSVPFLGVN